MNRDDSSEQLHVVARCTQDYHDFNKKILTHIKLLSGDHSIYFIPIQDMVGPLCVIPNIHNDDFRMEQDQESWMAAKPRQKWAITSVTQLCGTNSTISYTKQYN